MNHEIEARLPVLADRIIAKGEARVERQLALIGRLKLAGHDTETAEDFLAMLQHTLAGWNRERDTILQLDA